MVLFRINRKQGSVGPCKIVDDAGKKYKKDYLNIYFKNELIATVHAHDLYTL